MTKDMGNSGKTEKKVHHGTKNLKPMKPGQTLNPNGRPKGAKNRSTILRELADLLVRDAKGKIVKNKIDESLGPMTQEVAVNLALLEAAKKGDISAIREFNDTLYGKIKDQHEITGKDDGPIVTQTATTIVKDATLEDLAQAYKDAQKSE